jgi:uracil DNA glycosylase
MENRMIYEDFAPLFGDWAEKFKPFIESKEFYDIYQVLKHDSRVNKEIIVPKPEDTFKVFQKTRPQDLKVIFYLMDPYPRRYRNKSYQATGIAMDCSNTPDKKLQPSLIKFYEAISKEVGKQVNQEASLNYLLEQGVMMLNTDLTCKLNKTASHEKLWEPFQKFFLTHIMSDYTGIIYVLCGKSSKRMRKYIYELGNYVFEIEHPAAAEHTRRDWNSDGIFTKINKILNENNGIYPAIQWDSADWGAPF